MYLTLFLMEYKTGGEFTYFLVVEKLTFTRNTFRSNTRLKVGGPEMNISENIAKHSANPLR